MLNRRDTAKLVLFGAALPTVPSQVLAQNTKEWAEVLSYELEYHLAPDADGSLTLSRFAMGRSGSGTRMKAVVQLNWPPGTRSRLFSVMGETDEDAFNLLIDQVVETFSKAWPGKVV